MKILEKVYPEDTCPCCKEDMNGEDIYEHFIKNGYSPTEALDTAEMFGWTPDNKRCFQKVIGIETPQYDGVTWWMCPVCKCTWKRFEWSNPKYLEKNYDDCLD